MIARLIEKALASPFFLLLLLISVKNFKKFKNFKKMKKRKTVCVRSIQWCIPSIILIVWLRNKQKQQSTCSVGNWHLSFQKFWINTHNNQYSYVCGDSIKKKWEICNVKIVQQHKALFLKGTFTYDYQNNRITKKNKPASV